MKSGIKGMSSYMRALMNCCYESVSVDIITCDLCTLGGLGIRLKVTFDLTTCNWLWFLFLCLLCLTLWGRGTPLVSHDNMIGLGSYSGEAVLLLVCPPLLHCYSQPLAPPLSYSPSEWVVRLHPQLHLPHHQLASLLAAHNNYYTYMPHR